MRVGRIIRVKLNGQNHLGAVKSFNSEGLTAVFPMAKDETVLLTTVDFTKHGENKVHSLSSHDSTELGTLLRQLTGIAKEEKKLTPPTHSTVNEVLGKELEEEEDGE